MVGSQIQQLEKHQEQFRDFGGLIAKILIAFKKDAELVFGMLVKYLSHNPDIIIVDLESADKKGPVEIKYLLKVYFKCSWCDNEGNEQFNLSCWYSPSRSEGKPICSECASEAAAEARASEYEEEADEEEEDYRERDEDIPVIQEDENGNKVPKLRT